MKVQWKKLATLCTFALMVTTLVGAELPRAEWLGKVGDCANNAATMTDTMSNVSAADQVALVNAVNAALAKMPGSNEQRAAAYARANIAAVTAAMAQNKEKQAANQVIAEVFATVPPEYLTIVSEKLAQTVLNRKNMKKPLFITITTNTLHAVTERCEKAENAGVREAFAALTFLKGMGEQPTQSDISTMLSQMGDSKARETAASEWIGPALGTGGNSQSYDPMLGAANAGDEPDHSVVDRILAGGGDGGKSGGEPRPGSGDVAPPIPTSPASGSEISVALLGELGARGSGMETPVERMGGGVLNPPGRNAGVDLASEVNAGNAARPAVNNPKPIGGNSEGAFADNGGENPYYERGRGGHGGHDDGGYKGQKLKAW